MENITDRAKGVYKDTLNNKTYKIQEAIQKGLVVAEEATTQNGENSDVIMNKESTFTVTGVLHPVTGERLSVAKVREKLKTKSLSDSFISCVIRLFCRVSDQIQYCIYPSPLLHLLAPSLWVQILVLASFKFGGVLFMTRCLFGGAMLPTSYM